MAAETARQFEALEAQAGKLMSVFVAAGYEAVAPAIIQPADVFLDVVGEVLRARTYVFTDPDGAELCLRPDLTVPTCRLHLERQGARSSEARYCYNGAAFRFQPQGANTAHPREFRQAGIECFDVGDRERAEAEIVATMAAALKAAGLERYRLRIGDLGLLRAIVKAVAMPEHWRQRLMHHIWRPEAFRAELERLATAPAARVGRLPRALVALLDPADPAASEAHLQGYLDGEGIETLGARTTRDIAASLLAQIADAAAEPLPATTVRIVERYVGLNAPAESAAARIKDLAREEGIDVAEALLSYQRRLELLRGAGIDTATAEFSAEFGRALEYYTGFVFELTVPGLPPESPVAGGGRYDSLMRSVGAAGDVPAVGGAIHTERLLAAVEGGAS